MYLSIIIPAYNEEKRIGATLSDMARYLSNQSFSYEIIVVDNNSKDATAHVVRSFQSQMPQLKIVAEHRPGKGRAVIAGMLAAQGEYRLFTDADNSVSLEHLDGMMPYFHQGYDVVIGSLAVKGARIVRGAEEPWWRVILGKLGNKVIQALAVWGVSDTQRGFKIFTARAAQSIFPRLTIFGWGFDVEVLALARRFGYKIKEAPVTWNNEPHSKVNFWSYPEVLWQTVRIFWNLHTGKYQHRPMVEPEKSVLG